jgi:sortase A
MMRPTRLTHRSSPSLSMAKSGLIVSLILPIIVVVLVIAGVTIGVYPTASQWVSQYNYSRLLDNYPHLVQKAQSDQTEQLAVAEQYNKKLASGAQFLPNHRKPTGSKGAGVISISAFGRTWTYNQILNADGSGLMGQISIPKIDVDLPIYHGTDDATLAQGAGHLEGTSLPVGGRSTRTVITAHRGLAQAALFTRLNEVKKGDTFTLQVFGRTLTYRVINTRVVEPSDITAVTVVPGEDLATLVTCTPLGINSHRILVTGERIPTPVSGARNSHRPSDVLKFPWWLIGYLSVISWAIIWLIQQIQLAVRSRPSSPWSARHFSGKKMRRHSGKTL